MHPTLRTTYNMVMVARAYYDAYMHALSLSYFLLKSNLTGRHYTCCMYGVPTEEVAGLCVLYPRGACPGVLHVGCAGTLGG